MVLTASCRDEVGDSAGTTAVQLGAVVVYQLNKIPFRTLLMELSAISITPFRDC
jgi:hypothetical protein